MRNRPILCGMSPHRCPLDLGSSIPAENGENSGPPLYPPAIRTVWADFSLPRPNPGLSEHVMFLCMFGALERRPAPNIYKKMPRLDRKVEHTAGETKGDHAGQNEKGDAQSATEVNCFEE